MRISEVFYDDVKVPRECLVGEKNRGFYYIMEALAYERTYAISRLRGRIDRLIEYAKKTGRSKDPLNRQRLAQLRLEAEVSRLFALRIPWLLDKGVAPGPETSMLKVFHDELEQNFANLGTQILGSYAILHQDSKWAPLEGEVEWENRRFFSNRNEAGTPEIQRNIIADRGLGLPR